MVCIYMFHDLGLIHLTVQTLPDTFVSFAKESPGRRGLASELLGDDKI